MTMTMIMTMKYMYLDTVKYHKQYNGTKLMIIDI